MISLALGVLLLAYLFTMNPPTTKERVAFHLSRAHAFATKKAASAKITFAFNANVDVVAHATHVFTGDKVEPKDFPSIATESELRACFAFFAEKGSAGERFVEKSLFNAIVARAVTDPKVVFAPGGNAALMANVVGRLGGNATLGGPVGDRLLPLLDRRVGIVSSGQDDPVHLILEYGKGDSFFNGQFETPRANRFILHSDDVNGKVLALETTMDHVASVPPAVFVAAGVHLLQEQDETFRTERVHTIQKSLLQLPATTAVHVEFASVGDPTFVRQLADTFLVAADSMGCNEQELGDLYVAMGGTKHPIEAFGEPSDSVVLDALTFVLEGAEQRTEAFPGARRLTRIHFHFLRFHIVVVDPRFWSNTQKSCGAGSWAASNTACAFPSFVEPKESQSFDLDKMELDATQLRSVDEGDNAVIQSGRIRTSKRTYTYVWAPVMVCKKPRRTVGLGDTVSATALASTTFHLPHN